MAEYSLNLCCVVIGLLVTSLVQAQGQDEGQGQDESKTLIPPTITGSLLPDGSMQKYFASGDTITLKCNASGNPPPVIIW